MRREREEEGYGQMYIDFNAEDADADPEAGNTGYETGPDANEAKEAAEEE